MRTLARRGASTIIDYFAHSPGLPSRISSETRHVDEPSDEDHAGGQQLQCNAARLEKTAVGHEGNLAVVQM
jgi:hypothetical protein